VVAVVAVVAVFRIGMLRPRSVTEQRCSQSINRVPCGGSIVRRGGPCAIPTCTRIIPCRRGGGGGGDDTFFLICCLQQQRSRH
jgi:hypothetical protein